MHGLKNIKFKKLVTKNLYLRKKTINNTEFTQLKQHIMSNFPTLIEVGITILRGYLCQCAH